MKYNQLGNSDLQVSEIGFGCMSLGEDHAENGTILQRALDGGITFFDTADLYQKGLNEITVGRAFQGIRDKVILATKVGNEWLPDGSSWRWNPSKAHILAAIDKSLERLQTDYIDLYQLHGGTIDDPIDETIEAFEILKSQGKIRHYGISSIRPNVIREYVSRSNIISNMMQYSLLDRRPEESCLDLLKENNAGVIVRGGLAKGLLAGKPPQSYLSYSTEAVSAAAKAVASISDDRRLASHSALRYTLAHPAVSTAAIGIRTMAQLEDILAAVDTPSLTDDELKILRESVTANVYEQHR